MQKELSRILKEKLVGLPFIDILCGMVQTLTIDDPVSEDKVVQKRMPVTYDHNAPACEGQEYRPIPDSSKKSIIYFEDFGISVTGKIHGMTTYESSLRLVCWLNRANMVGSHYTEVGGRVLSTCVNHIANLNPYNAGMFQRISTRVAKIPPQDIGIFGRYTYTETDRQFLRPPFEFFAIDFITSLTANANCLEGITWNQKVCY